MYAVLEINKPMSDVTLPKRKNSFNPYLSGHTTIHFIEGEELDALKFMQELINNSHLENTNFPTSLAAHSNAPGATYMVFPVTENLMQSFKFNTANISNGPAYQRQHHTTENVNLSF